MVLSSEAIKNIKFKCPVCNSEWVKDSSIKEDDRTKAAYSFESCYRKCYTDNIAISNGKNVRIIFKNIEDNIPESLLSFQDKLSELLENCLNERHKGQKESQFKFYRSEDAFTWAYFGYVCKNALLKKLQEEMQLSSPITNIVFWGTPFFSETGNEFRNNLIKVCDSYNEEKKSRSEPDIIICTETELVFVEVKVDSGNPKLSDKDEYKVLKYKNNQFYKDFEKSCRLYELARNWSLGNSLAKELGKKFRLVNLMPEAHADIEKKSDLQKNFKSGLKNPDAYEIMTWESLFQCVDEDYRTYLLSRMNSILAMK